MSRNLTPRILLALAAAATAAAQEPVATPGPKPLAVPDSLELTPPDAGGEKARSPLAGPLASLGPLAAVLAASAGVLVSLKLWQKYGGGPAGLAPPAVTEVLGRTAIGPRQNVILLRVGRRVLVVAQADGTLSTLADIDGPEEVAALLEGFGPNPARPSPAAGFGDRLGGELAPREERPAATTRTAPARSAEQALADRLRVAGTRPGARRAA